MPANFEVISKAPCQLGEGPVWDHDSGRLFWLDSYDPHLFCLDSEGLIRQHELPAMVGSLAVIDDSKVLLALQTGLHEYHLETRELRLIHDPEPNQPETRMNDGKVDRAGNFVFGSMGVTERTVGLGSLYRYRLSGEFETLRDDIIVSNGPAFSPSGDTFYFTDGRRRILAYDYDPNGPLTNERIFFDTNKIGSASDGCTVDAAGNLWTALIGTGEIACIDPKGMLQVRLEMPIPLPSSVNFGGPALSTLYVTSISNSGNRTDNHPLSGHLFALHDAGETGLEEPRFGMLSSL